MTRRYVQEQNLAGALSPPQSYNTNKETFVKQFHFLAELTLFHDITWPILKYEAGSKVASHETSDW